MRKGFLVLVACVASGVLFSAVACVGPPLLTPTPTPVPFSARTFNVPAGQAYLNSFRAGVDYLIEFRFNSDLDINVSLLDPHGFEVGRWDRLESHSGVQYTAEKNGVYVLRFDNSFSLFTSKRVSVTLRVVPPWGR